MALAPHSEMTRAGRGTSLLMASENSTGSDGRGHSLRGELRLLSVSCLIMERGTKPGSSPPSRVLCSTLGCRSRPVMSSQVTSVDFETYY